MLKSFLFAPLWAFLLTAGTVWGQNVHKELALGNWRLISFNKYLNTDKSRVAFSKNGITQTSENEVINPSMNFQVLAGRTLITAGDPTPLSYELKDGKFAIFPNDVLVDRHPIVVYDIIKMESDYIELERTHDGLNYSYVYRLQR